jgi:integrase
MQPKKREVLEAIQLKHWLHAVQSGKTPTLKDPVTNEIVPLPLPLARSDGEGLTFTLSKSGTATWVLRYRYGGRSKELTIGNYPDISLSDARKCAREKRAEIDTGSDPAFNKRKSKALVLKDWSVAELIEDYREKILKGLSLSTRRSYGRNLIRIQSKLGNYPVSKIESLDIVVMIEDVNATWSESIMLLTTVKMLFRHAAGKRLIPVNPCIGIELSAIMGRRPPVRRRLMLSEAELKQLFNASMRPENLLAVKILLGTAVRSAELFSAQWDQLDLEKGVWTVPTTKTGLGMQIPLSIPVLDWFKELKLLSMGSKFVLPARAESRKERFGGDAYINPNTIGSAIDFWFAEHAPEVRRFTPHDLRSTAKSHMRQLGIPRDITEMCLNHKLSGVEGIYDIHTYFEERKAALAKWGDYLKQIESSLV